MKTALFAAALMFAVPSHATTWLDICCGIGLVFENSKFQTIESDGEKVDCNLTAATLTCADVSSHTVEMLPDNEVRFDGVRLKIVGDENAAICD